MDPNKNIWQIKFFISANVAFTESKCNGVEDCPESINSIRMSPTCCRSRRVLACLTGQPPSICLNKVSYFMLFLSGQVQAKLPDKGLEGGWTRGVDLTALATSTVKWAQSLKSNMGQQGRPSAQSALCNRWSVSFYRLPSLAFDNIQPSHSVDDDWLVCLTHSFSCGPSRQRSVLQPLTGHRASSSRKC